MNQQSFNLCDPAVDEQPEKRRLTGHCAKILALFRTQNCLATNRELAAISLKYTGRLSDLRRSGSVIEVVSRDHASGAVTYRLVEKAGAEQADLIPPKFNYPD